MNENISGSERNNANNGSCEQALVNRLAREFLAEQRSGRRWGIFFKLLLAIYLFSFLFIYLAKDMDIDDVSGGKHTALVDISGEITAESRASADNVLAGIRTAFKNANTAGIILRINSPGGSPVQAGYINNEINRLRDLHPDKPVYAVLEDTCASGGYYIAVAADMIYADKASLVGSIGVIISGFGYVETMEKLGVERRILHAGESKPFLDAFSPLKESDVEHVNKLLDGVYQQFIEAVKHGRGDRLVDDDLIFSGLVWTGEQSIELGLVDGLGSPSYVAREIIGVERIVNFTRRESYLDRLARGIGTTLANKLASIAIYDIN